MIFKFAAGTKLRVGTFKASQAGRAENNATLFTWVHKTEVEYFLYEVGNVAIQRHE